MRLAPWVLKSGGNKMKRLALIALFTLLAAGAIHVTGWDKAGQHQAMSIPSKLRGAVSSPSSIPDR